MGKTILGIRTTLKLIKAVKLLRNTKSIQRVYMTAMLLMIFLMKAMLENHYMVTVHTLENVVLE